MAKYSEIRDARTGATLAWCTNINMWCNDNGYLPQRRVNRRGGYRWYVIKNQTGELELWKI